MKGSGYGRHLVPVIVFLMISGCLDENISETSDDITSEEGIQKSYSVVAPVDTGINPYHLHFQINESLPQSFLNEFGVTLVCYLTQEGTWEERVEADRESCWDRITYNDTVYFSGTRIIGAMGEEGWLSLIHI